MLLDQSFCFPRMYNNLFVIGQFSLLLCSIVDKELLDHLVLFLVPLSLGGVRDGMFAWNLRLRVQKLSEPPLHLAKNESSPIRVKRNAMVLEEVLQVIVLIGLLADVPRVYKIRSLLLWLSDGLYKPIIFDVFLFYGFRCRRKFLHLLWLFQCLLFVFEFLKIPEMVNIHIGDFFSIRSDL